jgi:predicted transcriptional regulator
MKKIFFILLIVISHNIMAQTYLDYYKIINDAEIATLDKKFRKSDSLYQVAFKLVQKPFKEDYFLAAINADKFNSNEDTDNYLRNGVKNGLTIERIKKEIKHFKKSKFWKAFKKDYETLRKEYLGNINITLYNEIDEMIKKDQATRKPISGSWKQSKRVDSYNYKRLLKIIQENNNKWPGFSTIGEITPKGKYNVTKNIALMLLHFKKDQVENLKPYMLEAVLEGEMYPYHYARIIDYKSFSLSNSNIKKNGELDLSSAYYLYGTYTNSTIYDCKKAEDLRKEIGFESLDDFYRKINSTYKCIKK